MQKHSDEILADTWEKRWEGSETVERLTPLGRMMFKAKKKSILHVISCLDVSTVIEVGCGLGHTMAVYHDAGYQYIGIDSSFHAISVCKNKHLNCRQQELAEVTEKFDLVSSDGMLEHFLHFEPHAVKMMNISTKYVLLIQPNHDSFLGKTLAYLSELLRNNENVFEYNYRISDFISVFQKHGFDIEDNHPIFGDVFRLLLFKKKI